MCKAPPDATDAICYRTSKVADTVSARRSLQASIGVNVRCVGVVSNIYLRGDQSAAV